MLSGVSKTAILTLRARAEEHHRPDRIFEDPTAAEWWTRVEWPVELDLWYRPDTQSGLARRADDINRIARRAVETLGVDRIIELGCGLSTRSARLSDLRLAHWFDVDLPEVIALRTRWGVGGARHTQIASSVLDHAWIDRLHGEPHRHLFIAEGLLYYLPREEVDALIDALGRRFAGSLVLTDMVGRINHPKLLEQTRAVGTPVRWRFEGDFDDVLADLGLVAVPELEPNLLSREAVARYWSRFDKAARGVIFFSMHQPALWSSRSGNVLGRLATRSPGG